MVDDFPLDLCLKSSPGADGALESSSSSRSVSRRMGWTVTVVETGVGDDIEEYSSFGERLLFFFISRINEANISFMDYFSHNFRDQSLSLNETTFKEDIVIFRQRKLFPDVLPDEVSDPVMTESVHIFVIFSLDRHDIEIIPHLT